MLVELPQDLAQHYGIPRDAAELLQDGVLQRGSRDGSRLALHPTPLVGLPAHVVAVEFVFLIDVGVHHADVAGAASHQSFEQRGVLIANVAAAASAVPVEGTLDLVPGLLIDNALVLALVDLAAVLDFA